ncbi:saccharopine dehydrogenase family protein [Microbulbifer hainanensis]|uniref:saccharopine dehydrogenase family protein n=1 Tax=Microbulbifer hainanensis TaxID=2735675 RepID=UPI0018678B46|nr:DUF5938 domain-containing protein [Microbulbifer hainanensis]
MSVASDIVIWGASGYTGKLISESLHNRGIPFTAAGRSEERLRDALAIAAERAGVSAINAEIAVAQHNEESLSALFANAKVVVNVTGPFAHLGETVVRAALEAGCHYLDTTGEQDYMLDMKRKYSDAFADKRLLLLPALAYMWSIGNLAAEVALEDTTVDSLELSYYSAKGAPSVASSQSFMRMLSAPHYYLDNNELVEWELGRNWEVTIPGISERLLGSSWGGCGEPVWYMDDPRVRSCRVFQTSDQPDAIAGIHAGVKQILEGTQGNVEAREAASVQAAAAIVQSEPEKENPLDHRGVVNVEAWGNVTRRRVQLHFHSPYVMTGELIAEGCRHLLTSPPRSVGFQSAGKAFGHRQLLGNLADNGFLVVREEG